jgi:hypothetical protein
MAHLQKEHVLLKREASIELVMKSTFNVGENWNRCGGSLLNKFEFFWANKCGKFVSNIHLSTLLKQIELNFLNKSRLEWGRT